MKKRRAANDNSPRRYLVGAGNLKWEEPVIPNLTRSEATMLAAPLIEMHGWVGETVSAMAGRSPSEYFSIYAISDIYGHHTKIGKAANPQSRLAQLQTGNSLKLYLHRVFWVSGARVASSVAGDTVERQAHATASSKHERLEGEWFKCSPSDAHLEIETAVEEAKASGLVGRYCVITPPRKLWRSAA